MLVFCNGMPRSASTWSFHVVRALLERCFPGERVESDFSETPVDFLRSAGMETRHVVLKCHALTPLAHTLVRTRAARVVFTTRDLADAVVSAMTSFAVSFESALEEIALSLQLLEWHRQTGNAAIVPYEDVIERPRDAICRIAAYLGCIVLNAGMAAEIAEATSLDRMRQRVYEIHGTGLDPRTAGRHHDPETLLHPNHIGDGRMGKGRAVLDPGQLEQVAAVERASAAFSPNVLR